MEPRQSAKGEHSENDRSQTIKTRRPWLHCHCDPSLGVTPLSTAPRLQCSMWSTAGALQRCSINGPGSPAPAVAPHTPGHQHEGGQHSQHSDLCKRWLTRPRLFISSHFFFIENYLSKKAAPIFKDLFMTSRSTST